MTVPAGQRASRLQWITTDLPTSAKLPPKDNLKFPCLINDATAGTRGTIAAPSACTIGNHRGNDQQATRPQTPDNRLHAALVITADRFTLNLRSSRICLKGIEQSYSIPSESFHCIRYACLGCKLYKIAKVSQPWHKVHKRNLLSNRGIPPPNKLLPENALIFKLANTECNQHIRIPTILPKAHDFEPVTCRKWQNHRLGNSTKDTTSPEHLRDSSFAPSPTGDSKSNQAASSIARQ